MPAIPMTSWRKCSRSGANSTDCVEVAFAEVEAAIRDSKNPAGPILILTPGSWRAFTQQVAAERESGQ